MSSSIQRIGIHRRWSDFVIHRGVVRFVEVPETPEAPPNVQFADVLKQVENSLKTVGSGLSQLLQVQIILPYPEDLEEFNRQWDDWIPLGHAPSRCCLHAHLVNPNYRVELIIEA